MIRPLSDDLRRRVVTAVDDGMSRRGAAKALRDRAFDGDQVGSGLATDGQLSAQTARRRQPLAPDRGTGRDGSGAGRSDPGHDPGGDRGPSGQRARAAGFPEHHVALLPPPQHHLQKKRRTPASSNVLTCCSRRRAWFETQPDLDPGQARLRRRDRRLHQDGATRRPGSARTSLPGAGASRAL